MAFFVLFMKLCIKNYVIIRLTLINCTFNIRGGITMNYFFVFQNKSYDQERSLLGTVFVGRGLLGKISEGRF